MTTCRKFHVSGKVQGVFFRASTRRQAESLNITGHAINLADGRVEVLACGDDESLKQLQRWLQQGPEGAEVSRVERTDADVDTPPDSFSTG
mgnify:FL=1